MTDKERIKELNQRVKVLEKLFLQEVIKNDELEANFRTINIKKLTINNYSK